ncbi:hypothetical protein M3689_05585 [Alkalihalophilus marmarensis]|uniref:hypothetical protein n=1 Tax=Alkalihalophilus marmarensis TaxID=521377 RepID=UPI00203BE337|nr:hypothetical protein [Alkalihalophilus marmarensis]MCM3488778.1 hypothetical protein [Alkalihalophilus marmarensis]
MGTPRQKEYTAESGTKYLFQHPGALEYIRLKKRAAGNDGKPDEEKLLNELMKHVIVQPKTSWEYWDEHLEDQEDVAKEAISFLRGKDKQSGSQS